MTIRYSESVYEDLKNLDKQQTHMLLDYFEKRYHESDVINKKGRVFKTGPWRILFVLESDMIQVLKIIR